jgi:energy-coupling factor transporter transmembrane protein EcfT
VSRLHPFTLLAIAAALPLLAWTLPASPAAWAPAFAALTLAAVAGPRRVLLPALLTAAPFWLFLYILHDVPTMIAIGSRLTTMIAAFLWLVAVLPPPRLVEAMVAAGWSGPSAYLFAATLSAVPLLHERARRIVDAQRCRGLSPRGGPAARWRALRALALPLVLSALHEVDQRALALETRGLSRARRRTPLAPPPDAGWERISRWGLVAGCVLAVVWRLGWRR